MRPGHTLNPTGRFSDRAADYVRYRPSYPAGTLDAALAGLGEPERMTIADVGAGTGIASRLFAERGCRVIAVEPNTAMRDAAEPHERVEWREASAEKTGLADGSIDVVVCCQAFHWFDAGRALDEFARILRPGGRVALIWNSRDGTDDATEAYYGVVAAHATEPPNSPWVDKNELRFITPLYEHPRFRGARVVHTPNEQRVSRDGLVGRALSTSYAPKEGPAFEAMRRDLHTAFDRHARDGVYTLRYRTAAHLAENMR